MKAKKIIIIVTIIILSFSGFVYASHINNKNLTSNEYSDNIKSIKEYKEENIEIDSKFITKTGKTDKKIKIDGKDVKLKYKSTNYKKDIYISEDQTEYVFENDKLVGFIKKLDTQWRKNVNMNINSAEKIAENYLKQNIEDFSEYELTFSNYNENYGEYIFLYTYKVDGYKTSDIIQIGIEESGEITSFSMPNKDKFEEHKNLKIDMNHIENEVKKNIIEEYSDAISYEIKDTTLGIMNEKLVMFIDVNIIFSDEINSETSILDIFIYEFN